METLPKLKHAIEALIVASAESLKEANDTKNLKAYRAIQKRLLSLGDYALDIDAVEEAL